MRARHASRFRDPSLRSYHGHRHAPLRQVRRRSPGHFSAAPPAQRRRRAPRSCLGSSGTIRRSDSAGPLPPSPGAADFLRDRQSAPLRALLSSLLAGKRQS
eukprot:scaffold952_cov249-Pinguiococcus_pyrenoidosus.AAC.19